MKNKQYNFAPPFLLWRCLTGARLCNCTVLCTERISLRGPLCAGEAFPGGRPPRPSLYVKPAGTPRGAKCKVLLARYARGKIALTRVVADMACLMRRRTVLHGARMQEVTARRS